MNDNELWDDLDVVGEPPNLTHAKCEAFICQSYWFRGELSVPANSVHMLFDNRWHELVIDCGIITWRIGEEAPKAFAVEEEGWSYPLVDVGAEAGIIGSRLEDYTMTPTPYGSMVVFRFENGCRVIIDDAGDHTTYRIE